MKRSLFLSIVLFLSAIASVTAANPVVKAYLDKLNGSGVSKKTHQTPNGPMTIYGEGDNIVLELGLPADAAGLSEDERVAMAVNVSKNQVNYYLSAIESSGGTEQARKASVKKLIDNNFGVKTILIAANGSKTSGVYKVAQAFSPVAKKSTDGIEHSIENIDWILSELNSAPMENMKIKARRTDDKVLIDLTIGFDELKFDKMSALEKETGMNSFTTSLFDSSGGTFDMMREMGFDIVVTLHDKYGGSITKTYPRF